MRYVLFLVGAILISTPAFAQTQPAPPQMQPTSGAAASVLSIAIGTIAGMYLGNYLFGGRMDMNLAGGYLSQTGRYGGYGSYRPMLFGAGVIGTVAIIGSGILGGYVANGLTK